ncbi:MAG: exodeoxyribonuclease VII large subunit, partial [Treponema sp.]|nr:exodeoxyribonuclease VII large subunit [Treponema sp.]
AELVSASREQTLERVRGLSSLLYSAVQSRLERIKLLARPFSLEDLEYRFRAILQPRLMRFDDAKESLLHNFQFLLEDLRRRLDLVRTGLEAASPLAVMERGFSVVMAEKTGKVIRGSSEVKEGDRLLIRPLEGMFAAVADKEELFPKLG